MFSRPRFPTGVTWVRGCSQAGCEYINHAIGQNLIIDPPLSIHTPSPNRQLPGHLIPQWHLDGWRRNPLPRQLQRQLPPSFLGVVGRTTNNVTICYPIGQTMSPIRMLRRLTAFGHVSTMVGITSGRSPQAVIPSGSTVPRRTPSWFFERIITVYVPRASAPRTPESLITHTSR